MARSIAQIQSQMIADIQADPTLSGLTSTSKRSIWQLWTYIFATGIFILESLIDVFKSEIETKLLSAAPASSAWLQYQIFKFQYSATVPQVLQIINYVPSYPTIDTTLRIISRCSVVTTLANQVLIKVATGSIPTALNSSQLSALQNYVQQIGATVSYTVTSSNADQIYIGATIYYQGQYSAIISQNVILAINNYLASLPFDGQLKISDIEQSIRSIAGVNDCVLNNVLARADITPFASATYLVQNNTWVSRTWKTIAGYIIPETTTGQTLANSLTFIAQ
jgi:hypothetical protein